MRALNAIEAILNTAMGLDIRSIGTEALRQEVHRRMDVCREKTPETYLERITGSAEELHHLVERMVVPETWFFRHSEAFGALVEIIRDEWLLHGHAQPVCILSAACSTGEEPYSIVMALLDGGIPLERFSVEAVDISEAALDRAKHGVWGHNSFRSPDLSFRDRYFTRTNEGFRLSEELRAAVRFRKANLAASEFPEPGQIYDAIFCRNVLIYFNRTAQEHVIASLDHALASRGVLFVGPAEGFLAMSYGFRSTRQNMAFAYRRSELPSLSAPAVDPAQRQPAPRRRVELPRTYLPPAAGSFAARPSLAEAADLGEAQRLANSGRLSEAQHVCEAVLCDRAPSAEAYYLLGLILDATNNSREASACYRKALYLEPDNLEVLAHLALLQDRNGNAPSAQRLRERIQRLERSGSTVETTTRRFDEL